MLATKRAKFAGPMETRLATGIVRKRRRWERTLCEVLFEDTIHDAPKPRPVLSGGRVSHRETELFLVKESPRGDLQALR